VIEYEPFAAVLVPGEHVEPDLGHAYTQIPASSEAPGPVTVPLIDDPTKGRAGSGPDAGDPTGVRTERMGR
jgi:hypothetical protein